MSIPDHFRALIISEPKDGAQASAAALSHRKSNRHKTPKTAKDIFEQKIAKITKSYSLGPRVAAILSVIEPCRRLDIPVRQYLRSVLPGLAEFPANRVSAGCFFVSSS